MKDEIKFIKAKKSNHKEEISFSILEQKDLDLITESLKYEILEYILRNREEIKKIIE